MATKSDEALLRAAMQHLADFAKAHDPGDQSSETGWKDEDLAQAWKIVTDRLEAAYPHITPHGIGVKQLEWEWDDSNRYKGWNSETGLVHYQVSSVDGAWQAWEYDADRLIGHYATDDEGTAAAQADYETRILSALQRNPEGEVESTYEFTAKELARTYGGEIAERFVNGNSATAEVIELIVEQCIERDRQHTALHPPRGQGTGDEVLIEALQAMSGAFDTPIARRQIDTPFATEARKLCRAALSPKATKGDGE